MREATKLTIGEQSDHWWLGKGLKDHNGDTVAWMAMDAPAGLDERIIRAVNTFDQAREALKPFAAVAKALGNSRGDWLWVQSHTDPSKNVGIRFEDVQRALTALAAMNGEQ